LDIFWSQFYPKNQFELKAKIFNEIVTRFEVLVVVKMSVVVFWVVTSCGLLDGYEHFGGTYCHHLQGGTTHKITMEKIFMNALWLLIILPSLFCL
jgi:hypothetical protein